MSKIERPVIPVHPVVTVQGEKREAITQEEFDNYCKWVEIIFGVDAWTGEPIKKRMRGK